MSFEDKLDLTKQLIEQSDSEHFIIFSNNNTNVKKIELYLNNYGIPTVSFFSDQDDKERLENLYKFRAKEFVVLVCGDGANRGIHFDFNSHVIQFDSATNATNLLHRFGRTGRLGQKGSATSFMRKEDYPLLSTFQELIDNSKPVNAAFSRKRSFSKRINTTNETNH